MHVLARRASHIARRTSSTITTRSNSSVADDSTTSSLWQQRELLQRVSSLRAPPTHLHDLVLSALSTPPDHAPPLRQLALELGLNPSLGSSRWDDIQSIPTRNLNSALKVVLQPAQSHSHILDALSGVEGVGAKLKIRIAAMRMRYLDAPFLSGEHLLQILNSDSGIGIGQPSIVLGHWLAILPAHLVRLNTTWERAVFPVAKVRKDAVDDLHLVESWIIKHHPSILDDLSIRRALMHAYASTRLAPTDVTRHWSFISSLPVATLPLRAIEHSLSSAPTLDALHAVWSHFKKDLKWELTPKGQLSAPRTFYAQHLSRLGALDEAEKFLSHYPPHGSVAWMFPDPPPDGPKMDKRNAIVTQKNRLAASELRSNGLDLEDVLFVMSVHSPFYMSARDEVPDAQTRRGLPKVKPLKGAAKAKATAKAKMEEEARFGVRAVVSQDAKGKGKGKKSRV
ncbi:hypothetical protein EXIGLDRAFT_150388 [Exidia glandulosa HHB12029]|uniref:Uncharacterized protein n=1 Tax=Exidia glandulosa HHB12029 TaxID=1314781 RepID=A0A165FLQ6_EXIGL|nr:hypothetical protein EXIGLDRAFT_150388 [Exidia glandulosa HHB12029]